MQDDKDRIETRVIHAGDPRPRVGGALTLPIFQSAVFEHKGEDGTYHDVLYPRLNNLPNHTALGRKLAALEGAEAAVPTASGMAAISTALLSVLGKGGHLLVQGQLYGGTHMLLTEHLERFGMEYEFIDSERPEAWDAQVRSNTRAIYAEAITNPTMQVMDHERVVEFARRHGLVSLIDNTFATPVNFRPIELGYDVVLHSATKYLNGHSDVVAGAIAGTAERVDEMLHLLNELGGTLDAHACFLLNRGLKTLVLRVRQQNANALALARHLEARSDVARVNYPGLESRPDHVRAARLFEGFGGMLSFEFSAGADAARRFTDRVRIPVIGPSLGGVETLITRPATTSHRGLSADERARLGIGDGLMRVSVGIEALDDLIEDFDRACAPG
jgi:cystathionine beta-lyase/cystathionine gamma-synthase